MDVNHSFLTHAAKLSSLQRMCFFAVTRKSLSHSCTPVPTRIVPTRLYKSGFVSCAGIDSYEKPLDWETRVKVALGAARGLVYLHEDSNPRIIHRDFKASNILLDNDYTAKVSDFGLAKAAPDDESGHISTRVMGTFGYACNN